MSKAPIYNFYHCCPQVAALKIIEAGRIDPSFSQGKRPVCWYVTRGMVPWAIAHVCNRHSILIASVAILGVRAHRDEFYKANRGGVYWSPDTWKPVTMDSAELWLQRIEHTVFIPGSLGATTRSKRNGRKAE